VKRETFPSQGKKGRKSLVKFFGIRFLPPIAGEGLLEGEGAGGELEFSYLAYLNKVR